MAKRKTAGFNVLLKPEYQRKKIDVELTLHEVSAILDALRHREFKKSVNDPNYLDKKKFYNATQTKLIKFFEKAF